MTKEETELILQIYRKQKELNSKLDYLQEAVDLLVKIQTQLLKAHK
jgi:hypothetical protein